MTAQIPTPPRTLAIPPMLRGSEREGQPLLGRSSRYEAHPPVNELKLSGEREVTVVASGSAVGEGSAALSTANGVASTAPDSVGVASASTVSWGLWRRRDRRQRRRGRAEREDTHEASAPSGDAAESVGRPAMALSK